MGLGNSKNCYGIMEDGALWKVNKNSGLIKFCGLSGHAKFMQRTTIDNFFGMTT